ncbi:hypothetical protein SKAU_G00048080 [Synaphobranchus kaupii]|uniref:Uncharacterized protein n=1 Tax=Synaphobranchus kaupii TaxID=118154 RepID=A0A9Q1G2E6_SYNKA|nr:hypothetical protein SKAU_G00048080 [Synaphobranchus kaupii]
MATVAEEGTEPPELSARKGQGRAGRGGWPDPLQEARGRQHRGGEPLGGERSKTRERGATSTPGPVRLFCPTGSGTGFQPPSRPLFNIHIHTTPSKTKSMLFQREIEKPSKLPWIPKCQAVLPVYSRLVLKLLRPAHANPDGAL